MKKFLLAAMVVASLAGCASVNMGSPEKDAAAKQFVITPGKAAVYVYRNETMGAAASMDVSLDGAAIGQTGAKTFLYKEVAPGKHTLVSKAENTDTLQFDAVAGAITYVWQEVKMGVLSARSKLKLVSETEGQKGVRESKLAETR
jgi:uncharacterized protein YceK